MAEFKYTATDKDGVIISETVVAENQEEVLLQIKKDSLELINIRELEEAKVNFLDRYLHRVTTTDKAQFLEYFASMLKAGLTVSDVLQAFYEDLDKPLLRKFVKDTQYGIRNGKQLSECFADYPNLFPQLFVGMIKVGEASGTLAESLTQLATQLKKTNELKGKVRNAMIYPAMLSILLVLVVAVLLIVVFPRLEEFFGDADLELPGLTVALINIGKTLSTYWPLVIGFFILLFVGTKNLRKTKSYKTFMGKLLLKIPIAGPLTRSMNVALMFRTFGSLLKSGVNILEAVDVVQQSLSNQVYINIMDTIRNDLEKGNSLADSMKKYPDYFAPFEIRVLFISDRTGETAEGLTNVAEFYENKIYGLLTGLSSAIEPMLLIAMGGIVAIVVLSVITPIYQLLAGVEGV